MIDVAIELMSAFARHAEHGVNPMAASLPRKRFGGMLPDHPAPRTVTIYDDVNDKCVQENIDPERVPALVLFGDSATEAPANRLYKTAKNVIIGVAYVTEAGEDSKRAVSERELILRAARLCFYRLNNQDMSTGYRLLNGYKLFEVTSITEQRVTATVGKRRMWGWLEVSIIVGETLQ